MSNLAVYFRIERNAMKPLSRRAFLAEAAIIPSLAAKLVNLPLTNFASAEAVPTVAAEIGCLYPSTLLLNALLEKPLNGARLVLPENGNRGQRDSPTIIEFALVFPEARESRESGLLQPEYQETLLQETVALLKHQYDYQTVNVEVRENPSFWYPFLPDPIVFCRLSIRTTGHARS
jgi:hypothetical protein